MTQTYRITPRAEADLYEIAQYTEAEWGKEQRDRYLRALDARFQWLAGNPRLGQKREDVAVGYYCYPQGKLLSFICWHRMESTSLVFLTNEWIRGRIDRGHNLA